MEREVALLAYKIDESERYREVRQSYQNIGDHMKPDEIDVSRLEMKAIGTRILRELITSSYMYTAFCRAIRSGVGSQRAPLNAKRTGMRTSL